MGQDWSDADNGSGRVLEPDPDHRGRPADRDRRCLDPGRDRLRNGRPLGRVARTTPGVDGPQQRRHHGRHPAPDRSQARRRRYLRAVVRPW